MTKSIPPFLRLLQKHTVNDSGCWEWTGQSGRQKNITVNQYREMINE